jgi:hypothetical protein
MVPATWRHMLGAHPSIKLRVARLTRLRNCETNTTEHTFVTIAGNRGAAVWFDERCLTLMVPGSATADLRATQNSSR